MPRTQQLFFGLVMLLLWSCHGQLADSTHIVESKDSVPIDKLNLEAYVACPDPDSLVLERSILGFVMGEEYENKLNKRTMDSSGQFRESYVFTNRDQRECLLLFPHPGSIQSSIWEARIFSVHNQPLVASHIEHVDIDHFITDNGIRLGVDSAYIKSIYGNNYTDSARYFSKRSDEVSKMMYYVLSSPCDTKDSILERKNMPVYYMQFELKENRLIEYWFGYMYP